MVQAARDVKSLRSLLDRIKKEVVFGRGLVLTTVPRGGLQIAQPSNIPAGLVKAYSRGYESEDRLTWQAIVQNEAVDAAACWPRNEFTGTAYWRELMSPLELAHVVALPLRAPVLPGFPGSVHLCRTEQQGNFTRAEINRAMGIVRGIDGGRATGRTSRKGKLRGVTYCDPNGRQRTQLIVLDSRLRPLIGAEAWMQLDDNLREQMGEQATRRMHQLNGHGLLADRVQFPDTDGDVWTFRVITYRSYPALGQGAFIFFCLQPGCAEWGGLKASDFQADAELSRLIPSLRYMQSEFRKGPTLVEIAKVAGLSPFHFHRRFTEVLGLTPKQFMLECQIHEAKQDLLAGHKELADIARNCGFAHQSHFTSRFRQATGLTPTRWRRTMSQRHKASSN